MNCFSCGAKFVDFGGVCKKCKAPLPWAEDIRKMRDELKEREVNRGRATFTLIDELVGHAKGEKPVSVAAIKGFAFAWLFPRTLIVVGSIITGLVLIVQTAIIFQQTQLLERQTEAAQVDRAEKLRVRAGESSLLVRKLAKYVDALDGPLPIWCRAGKCAGTNVERLMQEIVDRKAFDSFENAKALTPDAYTLLRAIGTAQHLRSKLEGKPIDESGRGYASLAAVDEVIDQSVLRCLYEPARAGRLTQAIATLRRWSLRDDEWKYPRPDSRIRVAVRSLNTFVANKPPDPLDWLDEVDPETYRIAELEKDYTAWKSFMHDEMAWAHQRCQALLHKDLEALNTLEGYAGSGDRPASGHKQTAPAPVRGT